MKSSLNNAEPNNLIVSTADELPNDAVFGTVALVIATGEIKIFDTTWKTLG